MWHAVPHMHMYLNRSPLPGTLCLTLKPVPTLLSSPRPPVTWVHRTIHKNNHLHTVLQVGISLNYNKVYGWIDFDQISPEYISKNFDRQWKAQAAKYPMDLPNMKRLYQAVDVIGVSGAAAEAVSKRALLLL